MKKISLFIVSLIYMIAFSSLAQAKEGDLDVLIYLKEDIHTRAEEESMGDPDLYIERLKELAEESQASLVDFLEASEGVGAYEGFFISNLVHARISPEIKDQILAREDISHIELNSSHDLPSGQVLSLSGLSSEPKWNMDMMEFSLAKKAYNVDGSGITIGFIDSAVDFDHSEIRTNFRGYNNGEDLKLEGNYIDILGGNPNRKNHGTGVVSIAMGKEDGYVGGIAPGADWILARTFDNENTSNDVVLKAAQWMLAPGGDPDARPNIVNNSWGGTSSRDKWFEDILKTWNKLGIFGVFASGNSFDKPAGPGSIENPASVADAFAVGAIGKNKGLCSFSKRGPSLNYPKAIKPEVVAPGEEITIAIENEGYGIFKGTSASTPHITGLVALIMELRPDAGPEDIRRVIIESANPLVSQDYPESPNNGFGYGLPSAKRALDLAAHMKLAERISGDNRFTTAVNISKRYFPDGAGTVYLANGNAYIDALVMSTLTKSAPGPLLLTGSDSISKETLAEIDRLDPSRIVAIGGAKTINESVLTSVQGQLNISVERIAGDNRYDTSAEIAKVFSQTGRPKSVYLVNGHKEADAISASGPAKYSDAPVLLVGYDRLPDVIEETIEELGVWDIKLIGGEGTISRDLEEDLRSKGYGVSRLGGSDRYETSVLINKDVYTRADMVFLANGISSVDALAAGPIAGTYGYPMILSSRDKLSDHGSAYINSTGAKAIRILGGPNSISESLEYRILFN